MSAGRRLVLVTSSFPIQGDGSEAAGSFVADLVETLAARVPVCVVAPGPERSRESWSDRIEVWRYAAPARPLSTLRPWWPHHLLWIARVLRGGSAVTREAAQGSAYILALWGLPCGEWARRAAKVHGMGYSVWMLGSDVWTLGRVPLLRRWLARVIREASSAFADGYRLADDACKIAGAPVEFLPSTRAVGLTGAAPPRAQPPYRLLFLGRWHPNKGIDLLLDALSMLDDADWSRIERVEIQGGGPLEKLVRERGASLQRRGRPVEIGRYLSKVEAEAAIARADWVLIPSRIESIPVVFSDAMKMSRPVITTPVGDLPRMLGSLRCGICADAIDARAIANSIKLALQASAGDYVEAVHEAAKAFSLESIAERLLQPLRAQGK
jgi:glycosyltransferase involved in cell wall biosynthesis